MKLYRILIEHCAPKDCIKATQGYLFAESDEDVYEYIDKELHYGCWSDKHNDAIEKGETFSVYDDDYEAIGEETYKERLVRLKGSMFDEDSSYDDAYYGVTHYGWEEVNGVSLTLADQLFNAGITLNNI